MITLLKAFTNWEISRIIILNRDSKFLFDFWKVIFIILKIELMIFIIYYSQINE